MTEARTMTVQFLQASPGADSAETAVVEVPEGSSIPPSQLHDPAGHDGTWRYVSSEGDVHVYEPLETVTGP